MSIHWITRLYSALLHLYPPGFYGEFAEEMIDSFSQAVEEARTKSVVALGRLFLNEAASLPGSILYVHRQARRQHRVAELPQQNSFFEQSWRELILALAVFLLPAVMILIEQVQQTSRSFDLPATLFFLAVMITIGWFGGLPLWSKTYIGTILAVAVYLFVFQWVISQVSPSIISSFSSGPWDPSTYMVLEIISNGMLWLMLFCLTLLVVALLAVFNRFQPLLSRVRQDWSLLSFIIYGESVFALLLFESRRYDPNYSLASLLCLLAGIWFFLRSQKRRQRLLALASCLTVAALVAVLADWPPALPQDWIDWSLLRLSEDGRLLFYWLWMMACLLLPGLLSRRLSRRGSQPSPPDFSGNTASC